jgi:hypothetical protein
MRKLSGAKDKLGLRVHGLIVGSPEKKRADPAVLRALCTAYLPNGRSEVLAGFIIQPCSYTHTSCAKLAVIMSWACVSNKVWHEPACDLSQALVTEFEGWASVDKDSSMQFDWDDLAGEDQCPAVSHDCCGCS